MFNTSRHQWSHMFEIEKIAKLFKPCSLLSFLFSLLLFLCFLIIFFGNCNAYPLGFFRHQTSCYYSTQYQEMLNAKHNSHNIPEKWKQIEISKCKWIILIQKTMGNYVFLMISFILLTFHIQKQWTDHCQWSHTSRDTKQQVVPKKIQQLNCL